MINFTVTAPGCIKLFGEYGLRYKQTAVVSTLNIRTELKFMELPPASGSIIAIKFDYIGLSCNVPLQTFLEYFYGDYRFDGDDTETLYNNVIRFIAQQELCNTYIQGKFLKVFFYLFAYIGCKEKLDVKSFQIDISNVIDRGLGNARSYVTCIATCFFYWSHMQKGTYPKYNLNTLMAIMTHLKSYFQLSWNPELFLDIAPCIFGDTFEFRTVGNYWKCHQLLPQRDFSDMTVLLIDTLHNQDMISQRRRAKDFENDYPAAYTSILKSIDAISKQAIDIYKKIDKDQDLYNSEELDEIVQMKHKKIESLVSKNQHLLCLLGVTNRNVNQICSIAYKHGLSGKYTDDGRYAFIWFHKYIHHAQLTMFEQELQEYGFVVTKEKLNCQGVRIENIIPSI